jgi:hypothetical protein
LSHKVSISPEAEYDISGGYHWYEERSRGLGTDFLRAVDASLASIQRNPFAHPVVFKPVRRALLRRFPFGLYYATTPDTVTILGFHAKRDQQQLQSRS